MRGAAAAFLVLAAASGLPAQVLDESRQTRERMVREQIESRGIDDRAVLRAMREVPRHLFVPPAARGRAYADYPLPIGEGQTISQPYIVALMSQLMSLSGTEKVLEIGTGSGYQAAVLSHLCARVFSIEIKEKLHDQASRRLAELGYANVATQFADGYSGWTLEAPFDAIMITAAVDHIPPPLLGQLAEGGRLILPLGNPYSLEGQVLVVVTRAGDAFTLRQVLAVRFVPMTGRAQSPR